MFMISRDDCQLKKLGVRPQARRGAALDFLKMPDDRSKAPSSFRSAGALQTSFPYVRKPKIDCLTNTDPETDDRAEQFDRFQVMLGDHQDELL